LFDALSGLNSRLSVGMNFSDYSSKLGDAKVAYDDLPISSLEQSCISAAGVPLEDALNAYITAYNTWNACISSATTCNNDANTKALQAQWTIATTKIDLVRPLMLQ
jgi:hypothetical protein